MNLETFESSALQKYVCMGCRRWVWADGIALASWLDAHAGCESRWVSVGDNHYVVRDVLKP